MQAVENGENKGPNRLPKIMSLASLSLLSFVSCAETVTFPEKGVVTVIEKSSLPKYSYVEECGPDIDFMTGEINFVCKTKKKQIGSIATNVVTVASCRASTDGTKHIADSSYLSNSNQYPSDYRLTHEGTSEDNVKCGAIVEVLRSSSTFEIGQIVDLEELFAKRLDK